MSIRFQANLNHTSCKKSFSLFSQLGVSALWMSSSVTTLCVNPLHGNVTGRMIVGTTLTRVLKSAVSITLWITHMLNLSVFILCPEPLCPLLSSLSSFSARVLGKFQCPPTRAFRCQNDRVCLQVSKRCDGVNNCGDNSDELNCRKLWSRLNLCEIPSFLNFD